MNTKIADYQIFIIILVLLLYFIIFVNLYCCNIDWLYYSNRSILQLEALYSTN